MLQSSKKGFTIIEVVIVLVIGAIIMLMVFLIVPQLQRSQRDARRQSDARTFLASAEQFATQNNGNYPSTAGEVTTVVNNFVNRAGGFLSPNGNAYLANNLDGVTAGAAAASTVTAASEMEYRTAATCTGPAITALAGQTRRVAVMVFQENGGSFCVNN